MLLRIIILLSLLLSFSLLAKEASFNKIKTKHFWPTLYNKDYTTLYCGHEKEKGDKVDVEQIYAASWIAKAVGCKNRDNCDNDIYKEASSDLHNLWPATGKYNKSRGNQLFGEIEGEITRFKDDTCDYERTSGKNAIVEPREDAKGRIARSFLYMVHWYDLPDFDLLPLMVKWHVKYPPTPTEIARQDQIEKTQGRRNEFIKVSN